LRLLRDGDDLTGLVEREGERLVDDHVLARAHGGDRKRGMRLVGSGDDDEVDVRRGDRLVCRVGDAHARVGRGDLVAPTGGNDAQREAGRGGDERRVEDAAGEAEPEQRDADRSGSVRHAPQYTGRL
jgi:hypothetical protein